MAGVEGGDARGRPRRARDHLKGAPGMNWYETAFRKQYLDLYYHRDDAAAKGEASP